MEKMAFRTITEGSSRHRAPDIQPGLPASEKGCELCFLFQKLRIGQ